jgi:hypothetical protein
MFHKLLTLLRPCCWRIAVRFRFGHVVGKGAVAKDHLGLAGRGQLLVPIGDAMGQRLDILRIDLRRQADE